MRDLQEIFELTDGLIPTEAKKTMMFCEIEEKAYEIVYYSYFGDGPAKQCYELAEEGKIESAALDKGFEEIALFVRNSSSYDPEKRNVLTVLIEGAIEKVQIEQFDKSVGLYKIKKEWKAKNL